MNNKGLPNNIEAEKALLGSVFWSYGALQKACEEMDKDYFYLDTNSLIFDVIKSLYDNKKPVLEAAGGTNFAIEKDVVNSNGFYTLGSAVYENTNESGFSKLVFLNLM